MSSSAASSSRYAPICATHCRVVGVASFRIVDRDPGDVRLLVALEMDAWVVSLVSIVTSDVDQRCGSVRAGVAAEEEVLRVPYRYASSTSGVSSSAAASLMHRVIDEHR